MPSWKSVRPDSTKADLPPATPEVERKELHFRRIDMRGYRRSDGLYEIEGSVCDRKSYDFEPVSGGRCVPAGEPVHDMGVRLVIDEQMRVHAVETFTKAAPYRQCPEGGRALQSLVGLSMTSGWTKEVRSRIGGAASCTHLMELLTPMATAAFQSLSLVHLSKPERLNAQGRPLKIDSCYAYGATRELVSQRWPAFHQHESDETKS